MQDRHPIRPAAAALVLLSSLATAALAADPRSGPDDYGLEGNLLFVSAEDFTPSDITGSQSIRRCHDANYWCANYADVELYAPVRLPTGALITGLRIFYEDSTDYDDLSVELQRSWAWGANRGTEQLASWSSFGEPGVAVEYVDVDPDVTVLCRWYNGLVSIYQSYVLEVRLSVLPDIQFRGIAVYWNRQISPAPASQTFPDVNPGFWAFQEIEALAASGITEGFPDGTFRPTNPVTRAQMATFLARALGLHWAP